MRFTNRGAQSKTSTASAEPDDIVQHGGAALPHKAESFFGARTRLGRRKTVSKTGVRQEGFEKPSNDQQKSLSTRPRTQGDTQQQDIVEDMPAKLNVWPNVEKENRSATDVRNLPVYHPSSRPGIPPRRTSQNVLANHYDPAKYPYYVSQQTSDSAVRDMSLHKWSPMTIHETASDPTLAKRPLKSALKKQASPETKVQRPDTLLKLKTSSSERKPRRLDLSQFFPRPAASNRNLLSPNTLSRSPSALTDSSGYPSPQETVHVSLKRPTANAPYTTQKTVKPAASIDSNSTTRPKIFEPDIFDQAKTHVRRPPKGIQNWFDGFDISSEEDSETEKKKQPPPTEPQELPANDLSSIFSPWHIKPDNEQPRLDRKASRDPVEDNLLAIEHAKERMQERMRSADQRKGSIDSGTLASVLSSEIPDRKRGGSRLALLELASESVLSLSDSSGDEKAPTRKPYDNIDNASIVATGSIAPTEPPRKLESKRSMREESMSRQSTVTSGSIPITFTDATPLPTNPTIPITKRVSDTNISDPTSQALRKLTGQATPRSSRSRRTTRASTQDYETVASADTMSSAPSDSHLMEVTEEEMILLEMMRSKRAAMQNNSFAEGYSLALKREQELMVKRRESAQQTAMKILKQREDKMKSQQRNSRAPTPLDIDNVDEQYRRKYSAIRKEEVDKALKLEKFLAGMKTPTADEFPEPPSRVDRAEEAHERPPQKFELLLPSVYSPSPSKMLDGSSPTSAQGSSPPPESDDIDDHHHQLRQFLASSSASEGPSMFPTPPSTKSRANSSREKRRSIISPSPVEEEPTPDVPSLKHWDISPVSERRRSISGRRLSSHQFDFSPEERPRASALPAPLRSASQNQQPYHLAPNFDFSPLEFPSSQLTASPSLSTSRASPLTPTFVAPPPSEKPTVGGASSSDNASYRGRAYTPDTDLTSLSASALTSNTPASSKKRGGAKKMPLKLNTVLQERGSIASITSAGEDVLAAWADLGGGTDALASRRRVR